jgi:hypothetical protein
MHNLHAVSSPQTESNPFLTLLHFVIHNEAGSLVPRVSVARWVIHCFRLVCKDAALDWMHNLHAVSSPRQQSNPFLTLLHIVIHNEAGSLVPRVSVARRLTLFSACARWCYRLNANVQSSSLQDSRLTPSWHCSILWFIMKQIVWFHVSGLPSG